MVRLTILYNHPKNADDFEKYYKETHATIASKMKGVQKVELAKVIGALDGSRPSYYRTADLYFDSGEHMKSVLSTPEGKAAIADLPNFATGGFTMLICDVV
jgi:uncharacterized protein (TIGR02118 family)